MVNLFSALVEAEPQGRASGLAVRVSSGSIGSGWLSIMCGRQGVPTVRYQKLVGAGAESCLREADVPYFQGFGTFFRSYMYCIVRIAFCMPIEASIGSCHVLFMSQSNQSIYILTYGPSVGNHIAEGRKVEHGSDPRQGKTQTGILLSTNVMSTPILSKHMFRAGCRRCVK